MTDNNTMNQCPKCKAISAISELREEGGSRFYCTESSCDFELQQEQQNMDAARSALESIKATLFSED